MQFTIGKGGLLGEFDGRGAKGVVLTTISFF